VTLRDGLRTISGDVFYNCSALKNIVVPDSVTSIGKDAFEGCKGLESLTVPFIGVRQAQIHTWDIYLEQHLILTMMIMYLHH